MKRKFLLILPVLAIMCCLFALSVSAEGTQEYYLVQSGDSEAALSLQAQGKTNIVEVSSLLASSSSSAGAFFANVNDGDDITFILAEDIVTNSGENQGILINKAITVSIYYNGFCHIVTNGSKCSGIALRNAGAHLKLFGTRAMDENGSFSDKFVSPTVINGKITQEGNLDARHGKVYVWVYGGTVYAENMRTSTGQEFVFSDSGATGTFEFINCACYSGSYAIGLQGQSQKTVKVENGYYAGFQAFTVLTGSYIKNATITGSGISMDCWGISNNFWELTNCSISKISTSTGRTHFKLIDCEVNPSTFSLGADGGGACYVLVYTTPTCTSDGTLNVYKQGKGATPVNDDSKYAQTVTDFYADPQNKAYGHSYGWEYIFDGAKYLSTCTAQDACASCGDIAESHYIDAMFVSLGYSVPEFGTELAIIVGFAINQNAIEQYEAFTGSKINYGCVVALKDMLGEFNAPLDENGDAVVLEQGTVVKADITDTSNSYMDLKVYLTEAHMDTYLLMAGFIAETKDGALNVSYMQFDNTLVEDNAFEYISYNNK